MTLSEFLKTASPDDATALTEARAYEETVFNLTSSEAVTLLLVQSGLYAALTDVAGDTTSPARGICMAFMDRVRTTSSFNWSPDTGKGQANRAMIDNLVSLLPELEPNLLAFKAAADGEASNIIQPFFAATLHDVKLTRGTVVAKPVEQSGGYVVITTTADTEKHNPRLLAYNERLGAWQRVNSFRGVGVAGKYESQVPNEWRDKQLSVDDAYGVL